MSNFNTEVFVVMGENVTLCKKIREGLINLFSHKKISGHFPYKSVLQFHSRHLMRRFGLCTISHLKDTGTGQKTVHRLKAIELSS